MKCVVCKQAETRPGVTTVTFARGEATFLVREVPAQVCPNCGEDYVQPRDDNIRVDLLFELLVRNEGVEQIYRSFGAARALA